MSFDDNAHKWALITGVSDGGLGDALTQELLSRDISVIATAPLIKNLDYLPWHAGLAKVQLDVTSPISIHAAVEEVTKITHGGLDILINNAGYGYMMPLLDAEATAVAANFDVNVFGLLSVTQAFFPLLRHAQGVVVNQCSIASLPPGRQPFIGTYCATKAAVASLSDTMRMEFVPFGVKVVNLVTGDVKTTFWQSAAAISSRGIPEWSHYAPIKSHVEAMMRGETNPPGGHARELWAKRVVGDILRSNPRRYVRRGYLAQLMYIANSWVPTWITDWAFTKTCKLDELKRLLSMPVDVEEEEDAGSERKKTR